MASIEFIKKRIAGAEAQIVKLNKKLDRIRKVEAQNWEDPNPYGYSAHDLKYTLKDLEVAQQSLEHYKAQLTAETEKANSRNVEVILRFLEMWKQRVREFYDADLRAAHAEQLACRELAAHVEMLSYRDPQKEVLRKEYQQRNNALYEKLHGYYRDLTPEEKKMPKYRYAYHIKVAEGEWEYILPYFERTYDESMAKLNKALDLEANRKYDFIIERTNKIVGKITDASNLSIGCKDDLNGYIIGTKGTAKVQTVGAGGYNIQCFHFRTLINPM